MNSKTTASESTEPSIDDDSPNVEDVTGLYRIDGIDETLPHTDLAPLEEILDSARFVGLGESIHTSGGYYRAKFRLFRYLVEELGFRAFAIESPWQDADLTREYTEGAADDRSRPTYGLFGVWHSKSLAELLDWIRSYNESNPDDPISMFGYDVQQPWQDYPALMEFIADAIPERFDELKLGLETNIAFEADSASDFYSTDFSRRMYDHEAQSEVLDRYGPCNEGLEAIEKLFDEKREELIEETSEQRFAYAELRLVGLRAWMDAAYQMFGRKDEPAGIEARDRAMAFALRQLHRLRCPDAKTAVWAHNMHLNKANHRINGGRSMGTFLSEQLEDDYRAVALICRHAETNWGCVDNSKRKPVTDPNAIETVLGDFDEPYLLYDTQRGDLLEPGETCDLGHWDDVVPTEQFDALFFLDHSPPKKPVEVG